MSKMVTSRIPDEIYQQGSRRLGELGLGASDLIRAAYDYLLKTGEVPKAPSRMGDSAHRVSSEAMSDFRKKLDASRLRIALPDDWDYKTELAEGRWADYEALA